MSQEDAPINEHRMVTALADALGLGDTGRRRTHSLRARPGPQA
jgi:hypothetical protein